MSHSGEGEVLCLDVQWTNICNRSLLKTNFEKGGRDLSKVEVKCAKLSKGIVDSYSVEFKGLFRVVINCAKVLRY